MPQAHMARVPVVGLVLAVVVALGVVLKQQHDSLNALRQDVASMKLLLERQAQAPPAGEPPMPPVISACVVDRHSVSLIASSVAELLAAGTQADAGAKARPEAEPPKAAPPTAEQAAAIASANDVLQGAIARGHLSPQEVMDMRQDLSAAPPDARQELRRQVAVAINQGKLVPDDPKMIFP